MTTYRAVVKYPLDASDAEKRKALKQGLSECALELYGELGLTVQEVDACLEDALGDVELEDARVAEV
jgi:hypothetical protein